MRSAVKGFIVGTTSMLLAGCIAMVLTVVVTIASMLIFRLLNGHDPAVPEFFAGFTFATMVWPLDRRIESFLSTRPPQPRANPFED